MRAGKGAAAAAPEIARDLALDPARLGILAPAWFRAFAAAQIPVGVALDHWRPRRRRASCSPPGSAARCWPWHRGSASPWSLRQAIGFCSKSALAYNAAYMLARGPRGEQPLLDRCTRRYALLEELLGPLAEGGVDPRTMRRCWNRSTPTRPATGGSGPRSPTRWRASDRFCERPISCWRAARCRRS
ncbi:MAG TPA: hypothetical protein VFY87_00975 [Geminicoccaceae bacterium]|nr:hypothetical protein [Geminicoccaceae bacterium]